MEEEDARIWSCSDVGRWLSRNGFQKYVDMMCHQHKIDGQALLTLTESDLREPPLQIQTLGDVKRLGIAIRKLQLDNRCVVDQLFLSPSRSSTHRSPPRPQRLDSSFSQASSLSDEFDAPADLNGKVGRRSHSLEPEYTKLVISYIYMFCVFTTTAFAMVIVHDRVPDMKKYPPLPDIVLDNLPYIPWAFEMCELTGLVLASIMVLVLVFHKHRFIVMRRMFSLTGTVFLLRCFTMLITSLSVPGVHLQCAPKAYGSMWAKMNRAYEISMGFGMSMQGVRSCGDYMFSGHTCIVTMLNFFITEYTPIRMYRLHTATWIMNIFAVFFILAAHEHYSIDVFIAFYLTSRLFLYYHSLANNRALVQQDSRRTRIWFPLFSFFESKCNGIVPNEYEWPLPWPQVMKQYFLPKHKSH